MNICSSSSVQTFFLSGGIHRDFFYPNFASSYLINRLTNWLDFLYGNLIWPCLLMCEVSRNLSKYNHPNQPTYPKISKKRSYKNIPQNFLKFCMNNHPTLGQILGKLYGDHESTSAVIALNTTTSWVIFSHPLGDEGYSSYLTRKKSSSRKHFSPFLLQSSSW